MRFVKWEMWHTAWQFILFYFTFSFKKQDSVIKNSTKLPLQPQSSNCFVVVHTWCEKLGSPYMWSWQSSSWHQLRSAIPWVKEIPFMFLESCFHCCLGGEKQEYKCLCVKTWEPGSVFSLENYNFTLRYFVCSTTQNILWEQPSPLSLYLWVF